MGDNGFVFTDELTRISNRLWGITSIVGAVLCGLVLAFIGFVATHPVARPYLDRVSFRILVYALAANTVFGIVNALGGSYTGPTWACGFTIWLLQLTLELSSFLIFFIALNMQLVIVHGVNGRKMEKYYIVISLIISFGLTVPAYASKQYGWDPLVADCWYSNANKEERLAWQIGTQLFWTLLTVLGEIITAGTVLIYMYRHRIKLHPITQTSSIGTRTGDRAGSIRTKNHVAYANTYRNVVFRIGLYPVASCIINLTSVACVINATAHNGVHSWSGYRVLLLSDFLYGGRAVVYAFLAATDPSLLRATQAIMKGRAIPTLSGFFAKSSDQGTRLQSTDTAVRIELSTVIQVTVEDGPYARDVGMSKVSQTPKDQPFADSTHFRDFDAKRGTLDYSQLESTTSEFTPRTGDVMQNLELSRQEAFDRRMELEFTKQI